VLREVRGLHSFTKYLLSHFFQSGTASPPTPNLCVFIERVKQESTGDSQLGTPGKVCLDFEIVDTRYHAPSVDPGLWGTLSSRGSSAQQC
jgi:hypothetical protein